MNRRTLLAGGFSCWLAGLALPELGAEGVEHPRSVLEGVKALEKPITYTETKIPLGELVQKVAADTGAPLSAAPGVADEPGAGGVKEMSAREVLQQMAAPLDYRWSPRGRPGRGR